MKRFVLICFLVVLFFDSSGQVNKFGVPFIKPYSTQITQGSDQNWCMTKDSFGNMYFGNQERGVIRYDGTKWSAIQIKDNSRIYSLGSDERGIVYVGSAFEFGYIQPDEKGTPEYISLADRIDSTREIQIIYSVEVIQNKVLFLNQSKLYIYDIDSDTLNRIDLIVFGLENAIRLVKINGRLFISDNTKGIFEYKDGGIIKAPNGEFFKGMYCTVILPFDETSMIVGTYFTGLFLYNYNSGNVREDFIDESLNKKFTTIANIYAGARLRNNLFAIGTTSQEGVLVFDMQGNLIYQLNMETCNLLDDAVHAMYCDSGNDSELWFATYGYINKAYLNIPITFFAEKQGIEYGVNDICEFNGSIYVSSDAGILRSYTADQGDIKFRKIPQTDGQYFPLEVIRSSSDEYLLTSSLTGLTQITKNGMIRQVENYLKIPKALTKLVAKKILQSKINPVIIYLGLDLGSGFVILKEEGSRWKFLYRIMGISGAVSSIAETQDGNVWFLTEDPTALYKLSYNETDTTSTQYNTDKGIPDVKLWVVRQFDNELYLTTSSGVYRYDKVNDHFVPDNTLTGGFVKEKISHTLFQNSDGDLLFSGHDGKYIEILFSKENSSVHPYHGALNLLPNVALLDVMESEKKLYLTKSKAIYVLDKERMLQDTTRVITRFASITVGTDSVVMKGSFSAPVDGKRRIPLDMPVTADVPEYSYDMNEITFEWTTPYFIEELQTEYSYKLEGYDEKWSEWQGISFGFTQEAIYSRKDYTNLPYGHYTFYVKSRTLTGLEGNELKYEFIILKPWYATFLAFVCYALAGILIIWGIISAYTRRLKNENIRLEGIVRERTAVVVKQKEELESSIHYAKRIQMALLPSQSILNDNIRENFILFRPRDIVSGDFYWMTKKGNRLYVVVADCTGHGVPGAFMSLLGMSFIDEIIDKEKAPKADFILNELRLQITESLKQSGGDDEAKDGMDMGLLVVDYAANRMEFSGAYNPCFRVRKITEDEAVKYTENSDEMPDGLMSNGKYLLETIYASKMPIGISSRMNEQFVFYEWDLEKGVSYYMSSDGYIDQFGGAHGRKFMKKNFKRLILDIQDNQMDKQRDLLEKNLIDWMGPSPQIDDILVLGIKI
ncbi:MAG: SpoIIE family protein phosphatase [Bacteroidota bacterium]